MDEFIIDTDERDWKYKGHGKYTQPYDECPHCGEYEYMYGVVMRGKGIMGWLMEFTVFPFMAENYKHDEIHFEGCRNCNYETDTYTVEWEASGDEDE